MLKILQKMFLIQCWNKESYKKKFCKFKEMPGGNIGRANVGRTYVYRTKISLEKM